MRDFRLHFADDYVDALTEARRQARQLDAPWQWSLLESAAMLQTGEISAMELTKSLFARIEDSNGGEPSFDGAPNSINAWARLYPELALSQASAADNLLASKEPRSVLCGVPLGLKDVIAVSGVPLTASSKVLEGNLPPSDSAIWSRLRRHGMVLLGHTHMHEFANGATSDQVGNPYNLTLSAGGSSSGSGAAVASGMVAAALGTDTGGSLRVPAALCGVVAIKPTYGLIPLDGVIPMAPSRDTAGPMARTVEDCSVLLEAMLTPHNEAWQGPLPLAKRPRLPMRADPSPKPLSGQRIAVTDRTENVPLDEDVQRAFERVKLLAMELGAELVEAPAPRSLVTSRDLELMLYPEAWIYHRQHFQSRAHLYRPAVRDTVKKASQPYDILEYIACRERRDLETLAWDRWMAEHEVNIILEPTVHYTAKPRGGGYASASQTGSMTHASLPRQWNILGYPVVALPAGVGEMAKLPVGVSLIGMRHTERLLIQASLAFQMAIQCAFEPRRGAWT